MKYIHEDALGCIAVPIMAVAHFFRWIGREMEALRKWAFSKKKR